MAGINDGGCGSFCVFFFFFSADGVLKKQMRMADKAGLCLAARLLIAATCSISPGSASSPTAPVCAAARNSTLLHLNASDPFLRRLAVSSAADCCAQCFTAASSTPTATGNSLGSGEPRCVTWSYQNQWSPATPCHLSTLLAISATVVAGCSAGSSLPIPPIHPPAPPAPPPTQPIPAPPNAKNVLLIVVDDLRPQLNASYGQRFVHTPNLDALAASPGTVVFTRAYAQLSWCSPSRNSFLSGRSPDTLQIYDFGKSFRETKENPPTPGGGAAVMPLPEFFKSHGYLTLGAGKVCFV